MSMRCSKLRRDVASYLTKSIFTRATLSNGCCFETFSISCKNLTTIAPKKDLKSRAGEQLNPAPNKDVNEKSQDSTPYESPGQTTRLSAVEKKLSHLAQIRQNLIDSNKHKTDPTGEWTPIYRFKSIGPVAFFSRLKLYQSILMIGATPAALFMHAAGQLENPAVVSAIAGLSAFALLVLYYVSIYTRRLVGVISISNKDDGQTVRIGHLTFWGKRNNVTLPYEDLFPLSELTYCKKDMYVSLRRYSDPKFCLYMPIKNYDIPNKELFCKVFGQEDIM